MTWTLKVVKSQMLGTQFFVGAMPWSAVDRQVLPPDDPHWDHIFRDGQEAQRKLNRARVKNSLLPYLLNNDDAFFSSVTAVMVPVDGSELQEGRDYRFVPSDESGLVGTLEIEDHVMMFAADGQHRRAAMAMAIRKNPLFATQRVPVVILPFKSQDAVRQIFSDLNLHAKQPSKTIGFAFETRDPIAIIAKRLMTDVTLFNGRVNEETNSLAPRSPYVITMNTLVATTEELLSAINNVSVKNLRDVTAIHALTHADPASQEVGKVANVLVDFWEGVTDVLPGWDDVISGKTLGKDGKIKMTSGRMREGYPDDVQKEEREHPGYVHAFGLGWQAIALAGAALKRAGQYAWPDKLHECLIEVDWSKGSHWDGIAMVGDRVNNTGPGIKTTAGYILRCGGVTAGSAEIQNLVKGVPGDDLSVAAE